MSSPGVFLFLIFHLIFAFSSLSATFQKSKIREGVTSEHVCEKDFYLMSLPKSGTHVALKLLAMLSGRGASKIGNWNLKSIDKICNDFSEIKNRNEFGYAHLSERELLCFNALAPNAVKIIIIRDLRDIFVSLVTHYELRGAKQWIEFGLGPNPTYDEKLSYAITYNSAINNSKYVVHVQNALACMNDPNVVVLRFEDIIGEKGGGSLEVQRNSIIYLAHTLGISLSEEKLKNITDNLFGLEAGPSVPQENFNKGQIGSWKARFTEEHKRLFNEYWGEYQEALGYPLAD